MIHPRAVVSSSAQIGSGTRIWQFASVIRGATIGENCTIGACSVVDGARIGNECAVGHGSQLHPGLLAGHRIFFGPGCIICNDPWPRVEKGGFDPQLLADGYITVRIGDGASIGAGAIVLPGIIIGGGAMIAAGAVVDRDVGVNKLFKRSGQIVDIDGRAISRMRAA